ncbi:hypothetical protein QCA50_003270 [Cerrena zonata]|uniref:Uncharacterized protein n=1 Tax=Cerrena zonata TaxID=2478898 RepID=A0AAW0GVW5_9APHY
MQTWVERIKLLSEAVMLRAEHLEMERDLHNYHQLSSLWKYNDVPGGARSDFKADVSSLQDSCIAKKKELTAIVHRLVDTNYWHVTPPTSDDLLVHRMDMQSSINQLRDNVQELFGQLRSLETKSMPPPPNVKSENQEEGGRPAKRRRLSEEVSLPVASSSSTLVGPLMQPLDSKEVAGLTEQVMKLEERIADLENELVVHDNNILMETEEIMTIKMEEWEQKHIPPLNRGSLGPLSGSPEETLTLAVNSDFSGRLQILEDDFMRTGEEVGVVIDEVANLITGSDQTQRELVHLREENAQLKDKISLLEERQEENRQTSAKHEAEIKALSAAVTAFLATANAAPPPPPLPTSQEFLLASYPNILQSIQEDLRPVVVDIHRQVEEMLQNHSQELSTTVMNKLALTLKSVHAFSEWVEKNEENVPHVIGGVNGINGHSKPGA